MAATTKYPKELGACLDKLLAIDTQLTKLRAAFAEKEALIKKDYKALEDHVFKTFEKGKLNGGVGTKAVAEIDRTPIGNVEDWDKFWAYCAKGNWDLLQKRVSQTAFRERLDAKVEVPGTKVFQKITLSVKPRKKGRK